MKQFSKIVFYILILLYFGHHAMHETIYWYQKKYVVTAIVLSDANWNCYINSICPWPWHNLVYKCTHKPGFIHKDYEEENKKIIEYYKKLNENIK